jgi:hypothetical protein
VAVVLVSAAWTVSATAGNPHGAPPGQQKASDSTVATVSTSTNVAAQVPAKARAKATVAAKTNTRATPRGKAKGQVVRAARATGQASASASTTAPVQTGVKPSSATNVTLGHNTHALASSNQTKLYGNGKTAGQIAATQAGFGSATLYGPGNSQPHKVICGPHNVDVHALKAHAAACTAAVAAGVAASVSPTASVQPSVASSVTGQAVAGATAGVQGAGVSAPTKKSPHGGGVLGARAELASATKPLSRAVLATVRKGTLPFTGLGLWFPVVLGLALIASGYGLRRRGGSLS